MKTEQYITRGIDSKIKEDPSFLDFVQLSMLQFISGKWGGACHPQDAELNDSNPMTAMGVYTYSDGTRIWIKSDDYSTEQEERRVITVLFPDEY